MLWHSINPPKYKAENEINNIVLQQVSWTSARDGFVLFNSMEAYWCWDTVKSGTRERPCLWFPLRFKQGIWWSKWENPWNQPLAITLRSLLESQMTRKQEENDPKCNLYTGPEKLSQGSALATTCSNSSNSQAQKSQENKLWCEHYKRNLWGHPWEVTKLETTKSKKNNPFAHITEKLLQRPRNKVQLHLLQNKWIF